MTNGGPSSTSMTNGNNPYSQKPFKRRVNEDGKIMLEAKSEKKDSDFQV
jgi:hypothetical protein